MAATNKVHTYTVDDVLGTTACEPTTITQAGQDLLDDADAATMRTTMGLGDSSILPVGTAPGTVAAGNHTHPGGDGEAFPIGAVFIAVDATNPGTLLGYGTWSAFGTGRVLVGRDAADTDFDLVEETGGQKAHVLSPDEVP